LIPVSQDGDTVGSLAAVELSRLSPEALKPEILGLARVSAVA